MIRFLTVGVIALLVLLRLARTRAGTVLLGVSRRALDVIYLVALLVAGLLATVFDQWVLLIVVGVLVLVQAFEEARTGRRAAAGTGSPSSRERSGRRPSARRGAGERPPARAAGAEPSPQRSRPVRGPRR